MRNPFEAQGATKKGPLKAPGVFPAIPATWPNRAIRRAVRYGRQLPSEWVAFFFAKPELKAFILKYPTMLR